MHDASFVEFPDPLGGRDDVSQTYAELVVHHDHFALGDQAAVDQNIHRFASQTVKLDDRTLCELEQVLDGDFGTTQFNRQQDRDVQNEVDIVRGAAWRACSG